MKSIDDIIDTLRELTYEDKLRWAEGDFFPDSYQTKLASHSVRVQQWVDDDDGTTGVTVQLYTGSGFGQVIDTSSASQFSGKYSKLFELYTAARRSAMNVTDTIKSLEKELKALQR